MKILVDIDSSFSGNEALAETIDLTVHTALDRYNDRLSRIDEWDEHATIDSEPPKTAQDDERFF